MMKKWLFNTSWQFKLLIIFVLFLILSGVLIYFNNFKNQNNIQTIPNIVQTGPIINRIGYMDKNNQKTVVVNISEKVDFETSVNPGKLSLNVKNANVMEELPRQHSFAGVEVNISNDPNGVVLEFISTIDYDFQEVSYSEFDDKKLWIIYTKKNIGISPDISVSEITDAEPENEYTTVVKQESRYLTEEQQAIELYKEAIKQAKENNLIKSMELSQESIDKNPGLHDARKLLVMIAFQTKQEKLAYKYLDQGLGMYPQNVTFTKIKANKLIQHNQLLRALKLLRTVRVSSVESDVEYFVLLAVLYQKMGQYAYTIELYQKLLKVHPDRGVWWAGLAIAIESDGYPRSALQAFQKALKLGGLADALQQYVVERINILK